MEPAAYVCSRVFENSRPVLLVSREGGDWQYLCGMQHYSGERPHVVGRGHLLERDPTLKELLDLPTDWEAERSTVGEPWTRTRVPMCD